MIDIQVQLFGHEKKNKSHVRGTDKNPTIGMVMHLTAEFIRGDTTLVLNYLLSLLHLQEKSRNAYMMYEDQNG